MRVGRGTKVVREKAVKRNITEIVHGPAVRSTRKRSKDQPGYLRRSVELNVLQEGDSVKKGQELGKNLRRYLSTQRDRLPPR